MRVYMFCQLLGFTSVWRSLANKTENVLLQEPGWCRDVLDFAHSSSLLALWNGSLAGMCVNTCNGGHWSLTCKSSNKQFSLCCRFRGLRKKQPPHIDRSCSIPAPSTPRSNIGLQRVFLVLRNKQPFFPNALWLPVVSFQCYVGGVGGRRRHA